MNATSPENLVKNIFELLKQSWAICASTVIVIILWIESQYIIFYNNLKGRVFSAACSRNLFWTWIEIVISFKNILAVFHADKMSQHGFQRKNPLCNIFEEELCGKYKRPCFWISFKVSGKFSWFLITLPEIWLSAMFFDLGQK